MWRITFDVTFWLNPCRILCLIFNIEEVKFSHELLLFFFLCLSHEIATDVWRMWRMNLDVAFWLSLCRVFCILFNIQEVTFFTSYYYSLSYALAEGATDAWRILKINFDFTLRFSLCRISISGFQQWANVLYRGYGFGWQQWWLTRPLSFILFHPKRSAGLSSHNQTLWSFELFVLFVCLFFVFVRIYFCMLRFLCFFSSDSISKDFCLFLTGWPLLRLPFFLSQSFFILPQIVLPILSLTATRTCT